MGSGHNSLPDGYGIKSADWHFKKFVEFTQEKLKIGEPSPHLAIVGHMSKDFAKSEKLWMLGCYGATYCLPSAQVIWECWSHNDVLSKSTEFKDWLDENWKGIITRTERRCVRSSKNMHRCLTGYAKWMEDEFPKLPYIQANDEQEYYDAVYDSVNSVPFFGRYISIRVIEGLRRYCGIPAKLYDVRSIGGWSPRKCLTFLYPDDWELLLEDTKEGAKYTDKLAEDLMVQMAKYIPNITTYVMAAMLCEYKGAYENRHQYVGWTIDQEPLLYDKVKAYFGNDFNNDMLLDARTALFPKEVLGEKNGWNGTRWDLTGVLRDYEYVWTDLKYIYMETKDFANPIRRAS